MSHCRLCTHLGCRSGADLRLCQGTLYDGVIDDLGFDAADVKAQTDGWVQTMRELQAAVIAAGGWSWAWYTPSEHCAAVLLSLVLVLLMLTRCAV